MTKPKMCETCRYWKQGDLSAQKYGNVGSCTFMLVQKGGQYARNERVPYWAEKMLFQTVSWQGESCLVHEFSEKAKKKPVVWMAGTRRGVAKHAFLFGACRSRSSVERRMGEKHILVGKSADGTTVVVEGDGLGERAAKNLMDRMNDIQS